MYLNNLGAGLRDRYARTGALADLEAAAAAAGDADAEVERFGIALFGDDALDLGRGPFADDDRGLPCGTHARGARAFDFERLDAFFSNCGHGNS